MYKFLAVGLLIASVAAVPAPEQKLDCLDQSNGDMLSCFAIKAINTINRAARSSDLIIVEGVNFVRDGPVERTGKALKSENEMLSELPRELSDKTLTLAGMLFDSALSFFKSHSLEISAPFAARTMDQVFSLFPARAKMPKKMITSIMGGLALKVVALLPIILGALVFLTVKALVVGKIALIIAAILAFQKLFAGGAGSYGSLFSKHQGATGYLDTGVWSNTATYAPTHSGYSRRSLSDSTEEAAKTAYAAQQPVNTNEAH